MRLSLYIISALLVNIFQPTTVYVGLSLIIGTLIFIIIHLILRYKRRQLELIEFERQLKEEQLVTQLKEKEIISIKRLVKAQEKERSKIVNNLHEELVGQMAKVKTYFGTFEDKNVKKIFTKTDDLMEEAYQKIRHIAHAKNSGLLAKEGLLEAVKLVAREASTSKNIKFEVHGNDLNHRLNNTLELTLFRIIQELINNVVLHARASEADIHIHKHDDTINIMVEDNGNGFNPSQILKKGSGFGLKSIDRQIENLDGKMIIESKMGVGTSVIIDLPLNTVD